MTHKGCVARHSYNILIRLPYLTWPWPLPIIRPILIYYLPCPLGRLLAKFVLAAVVSSVSVADKAKSDDFSIWPDLDLTYDLLRFFNFFKKYSSGAFDCPLARLTWAIRSRVRRGGGDRISPQRDVFGRIPPAGSGLAVIRNLSFVNERISLLTGLPTSANCIAGNYIGKFVKTGHKDIVRPYLWQASGYPYLATG